MPLKHYGIYIAYPPTVDLRHQGLGRYLAAFLKGASAQKDVRFSVVCPSWSREAFLELLEAEGVSGSCCDVVSPKGVPLVLRFYNALLKQKIRKRKSDLFKHIYLWLLDQLHLLTQYMIKRLTSMHSLLMSPFFIALMALIAVLVAILLFRAVLMLLGSLLVMTIKILLRKILHRFHVQIKRIKKLTGSPKDLGLVRRLYRAMEQAEVLRMQALINTMSDVRAWYCPTAFWPMFNKIQAPRLMCVPDVVLTDFPVGFSSVGGERFLENFEMMEDAINGGQHYVTYSADVKWTTLVSRYGVKDSHVSVVHHAPNDLSKWVTVRGFGDGIEVTRNYCHTLFMRALIRSQEKSYISGFANKNVKFFFYASQIRPNKNVLNLLRAYEHLLHKRLIGHKLILTGNKWEIPAIEKFLIDHHLQNEVLFLHGLKIDELAACYSLADLAVNPSLSEGGCPFTFTEALSVGTPVVMARIPVTEEVLTEPELQSATFFDPYDWRDMAARIEWALINRDELLLIQKPTYDRLVQRTWQNVVQEHITVLDRIVEKTAAE
jgi:glycosyltransferase involved in cell wall biosynthesis